MYAAGSAVGAAGGGLAASLTVLAAGFSAHTGVDRAGEVFGLAYQDTAKSLLEAAAAAVNACQKCEAVIQQGASNYSNVEAASTLGGGSGVLEAPSPPVEVAAPGPPGTWGKGEPPPLLWAVVQAFVFELWPDGDVAGLRAAASRWRGFAAAARGVQGTLNASKTLFDSQHIPEGENIDNALTEIGAATTAIGAQCDRLATKIDEFARSVDHAQHAIRDLLHRIEALGDLGHDIMLIIDGDAWDEIQKIAKDINAVLQHLGQEARAFEEAIRLLMQAADREIVTCEKYARLGLIKFLGEDVGNPVATALDFGINVQEGVVKGAVGMGLSLVDLSPHWIAVDPQGAAATWGGLAKSAWRESFFNAAINPQEFAQARLQELKSLVHAEDWSRDRPGLGAGEVAFDLGSLFAPGLGEAGAAADGAGAAARGAETEVDAAGSAGLAGGKGVDGLGGIAGARGALTDIAKSSADLPNNLEGATKDLPEIKPPASGSPVAMPPGKPIEPPVEAAPRSTDGAPGAAHGSTPATRSPGSPNDPVSVPSGRPHEPTAVPAEGPHEPASVPAGGAHDPVAEPSGGPHEPASVPAAGSRPASVQAAGDGLSSATPQLFEHSPGPASPSGSAGEVAPIGAHQPAPSALAASPHLETPGGRPAELLTPSGGGAHGPGDGGPPGGHTPEGPHGDDGSANGLTAERRDEIIAMPKGTRPDPSEYLSPKYIDSHLQKFSDGATRFMPESNLEKYGIAQRDGTSFVMPSHEADAMKAATGGDLREMENELGLPRGFLDSNKIVRIDISDPEDFNLRIPSGNEAGANEQWNPGGILPNGASEAVIDGGLIPPDHYTVSDVFE